MKRHLFYIHSYITYWAALATIEAQKLPLEKCVLMLGRGFVPSSPPRGLQLSKLPFSFFPENTFAVEKCFWRSWPKLNSLDTYVEDLTQSAAFHLYTNQTGLDFIRLFLTHPSCEKYFYLEEGLYSYYPAETINRDICPSGTASWKYKVLTFLNFGGRMRGKPLFFSDGYAGTFGFRAEAFPGFRNRTVVRASFENAIPLAFTENHIFAFDALPDYGAVSLANFENALKRAARYFESAGIDAVGVKYHPEQTSRPERLKAMRGLLAKHWPQVKVSELSPETSLELLAGNQNLPHLTFFVFLSSVGLYAAWCGRPVFSFANYLAVNDPYYQERVRGLPTVFTSWVTFL